MRIVSVKVRVELDILNREMFLTHVLLPYCYFPNRVVTLVVFTVRVEACGGLTFISLIRVRLFLATLAAQKFLEFLCCSYRRQLCPFFMGVWFPGHFEVWNAFSRDRPVSEAVFHGDRW